MSTERRRSTGPAMIRVIVHEPGDPNAVIHDKTGDHSEGYFRDWIAHTVWWAMRDGQKVVTMYPVKPGA
jgi:hypothetical protein